MRSFFALILLLSTAACANLPSQPNADVIVVAGPCFDSSRHDSIAISIINKSNATVSLPAYGSSGPPYNLHPRAFDVVVADGASPTDSSHWAVTLEEFTPPDHEVHLRPGDSSEFHAYASHWPTLEYSGRVKLRVRDSHGSIYESSPVMVCGHGSAPNNSFKPKPLRGSA